MLRRVSTTMTLRKNPVASFAMRYCLAINVPFIAESISEGKVMTWGKKIGDAVEEDEVIVQIESDKVNADIKAPKAGMITEILAAEGDTVKVGSTIAKMKEGAAGKKSEPKRESPPSAPTPAQPAKPSAPAQPTAAAQAPAATPKPAATPAVTIQTGSDPRVQYVRVSAMRQRIADRLKASQNTAAMLTTFNEIDMTPLAQIREKYKDDFVKKHGVKLGFMSPFAKACAQALQDVPVVNASFGQGVIEYHDYVDISVAVSTKTGLVVPVLRDVQNMNLADIEKKIEDFATRANENKLTIPEMTGGTFTISNGGTFGSWMGTPIINPPQSAILGMHAIKKKPWVNAKGEIVVRDIMAVALTYDHRLIDGRDAVTFLVKVKNIIEDPVRLVLDLA